MLPFEDIRWNQLTAGYRLPYDPRPLLKKLKHRQDVADVWLKLWNELHHQGDVGEASYAAVPHLVKIYRQSESIDWNTYAIVGIIELARKQGSNPDVPNWLSKEYFLAIRELAERGASEVLATEDSDTVRSILSILAIVKGLRVHGGLLINYSEAELLALKIPSL